MLKFTVVFLFIIFLTPVKELSGQEDLNEKESLESIINEAIDSLENGSYEKARHLLYDVLQDNPNIKDSITAVAWHKYGVALYYIEDLQGAIAAYLTSIEIKKELRFVSSCDLSKSYRNIGVCHIEEGDFDNARKALANAIDYYKINCEDSTFLALTYSDMAYCQINLGLIPQSKEYFELAEAFGQKMFLEDPISSATLYNRKAEYYYTVKDYAGMILNQEKCIGLFYEDDLYYEDIKPLIGAYHDLALAHDMLDSFNLAELYYRKSINFIDQLDSTDQPSSIMQLSNLVEMYNRGGMEEKAFNAINKGKEILSSFGNINPSDRFSFLLNEAEFLIQFRDSRKALKLIEQSQTAYKQSNLYYLDRFMHLELDKIKIRAQTKLFQEERGLSVSELIEEVESLYESIQSLYLNITDDVSRQSLTSSIKSAHDEIIKTLLTIYDVNIDDDILQKVLAFADKSKANTLYYTANKRKLLTQSDFRMKLSHQENELNNELLVLRKSIDLNSENKINNRQEYLRRAKSLDSLRSEIYGSLIEKEKPYLLPYLDEIGSDELIIEYQLLDNELLIFYSDSSSKISYKSVPDLGAIEHAISKVSKLIVQQNESRISYDENGYQESTNELKTQSSFLYQKLIAPIIGHNREIQKLTIVPDGVLCYLPFDILLNEDEEYLVENYKVNFLESISKGGRSERVSMPANDQEIGVFAPYSSIYDTELSVLPYSKEECIAISEIIQADKYIGDKATSRKFMEVAQDYNILHIATHGKVNNQNEDYAYLAFAPSEVVDSDNGFLYNLDIYNMTISSDLVVASACDAGGGQYLTGEGVMSLARAFRYAGAKSVVTSLWNVNDLYTKDFMIVFYNGLKSGLSKDQALRNAKLNFIESEGIKQLPYYWASFVGIGDMSPVDFSNHDAGFMPWVCIISAIFLMIVLVSNKSSKSGST